MDTTPSTGDAPAGVNGQIAQRVRQLRSERAMSLDQLAASSGVSRSMLSLIERGESSPTAALLEKVASALDVSLASLFEVAAPTPRPVSRCGEQRQWRDPASGYVRRNVSPGGFPSPIEIVEVEFPPGARVAFESGAREVRVHQQVWVLDGAIEVNVGDERHKLEAGDCLAFTLDRPTAFRNRTRRKARYAVVIVAGAGRRSA